MPDKTRLRFLPGDSTEIDVFSAFLGMAETVFGPMPTLPWPVWAAVDPTGRCVAGLQAERLRLACDGTPVTLAALRNIAVAEDWRGHGLMRDLLARVLPWCDAGAEATLLYTGTPRLYAGFGFEPVPQHAFEGPAPTPEGGATATFFHPESEASLARRIAARTPVSSIVATIGDGGLTEQALTHGVATLSYDAGLDALIAWEIEGDTLVLVDVVAPRIPTAAAILGALGATPARLRTMFPPDRLGWAGLPVLDDTGLMARGVLPPAMRRPFMLPPTVAF